MARRKNAAAVELGRRRMKKLTAAERAEMSAKGGKRRLVTMTPEQRKEVAAKAAAARWAKKKKN